MLRIDDTDAARSTEDFVEAIRADLGWLGLVPDGEVRQSGSTADFIFSLPVLLEYITAAMTLEPGDLLLTGTPAGVGPLVPGDLVEVSVAGLGTLSNSVQAEEN